MTPPFSAHPPPTPQLDLLALAPGASVQDLGRPGYLAQGLAEGGAADRRALFEAAALLDQPVPRACLELPLSGGRFRASHATRIALTGAPMAAHYAGRALRWNAAHLLAAGEVLEIGAAQSGVYGYLSLAGGIATPEILGARAWLAAAGPGPALRAGQVLPFAPDPAPRAPLLALPVDPRFEGGRLRVIAGPQTGLFAPETLARAFATGFRAGRGNRQGVALLHDGRPFSADCPALLSDFIGPGDIQATGAGDPMILLADCQSVGGYPRLGTVIPADLAIAAQARPGTALRLVPVSRAEAEAASAPEADWLDALRRARFAPVRAPEDIADLLGYQLIGGVVRGDEEDRP